MQNSIVDINDLPSIQMLTKNLLDPHYAAVNLLANLLFFGFLVIIAFVLGNSTALELPDDLSPFILYLPVILVIVGTSYGCYQWFSDKAKYYSMREHDISFFSGLLFKRLITQPISRIQHVEVSQGPIDRIAKLGKLQVYSAGSNMQTFAIPGLPIEIAHQLRQQLTQRLSDSLQDSE